MIDSKISHNDFLKFLGAGSAIIAIESLGEFSNVLPANSKNKQASPLPRQQVYRHGGSWTVGASTTFTAIHMLPCSIKGKYFIGRIGISGKGPF